MAVYTIADQGESVFHIVNNQYCDETVRFAASELQKYLLKATNAAIPYYSDRCPMRGPEIRVGANVRGETGVPEGIHEEGFYIRGEGEHITITAPTSRGVLYGVYRFLEIFCNFRCFTKDVETIDTFETLTIQLDEIQESPEFDFREAYFRNAFDGDFCAKSHFNSSLADISKAKGGRMKWYNFHHSFADLVSPEFYFEEHPEYFSLIDGERVADSQLCLTNPEVAEVAEKTLRRWIAENPECTVFSVAQNDNYRRCTCPNCMALEEKEGSPSGPVIHFVNCLADAIREEYPQVLLHTFAYKHTVPAPRNVIARDNVIVRLCSFSCNFHKPLTILAEENPAGPEAEFVGAFRDWKTHASQIYIWDYAVNYHNYLQPFFQFHTMAENIRYFKANGARGLLEQGNFAYGGGAAMDDLKAYLICRLLWNVDADVDAEMDRFFTAVYGEKAALYMKEYVRIFEEAPKEDGLFIKQYPNTAWVTDGLVAQGEALFEKALAAAENDTFRQRIAREQLAVRYLRLVRLPLDAPGREIAIDQFFNDVKSFGITEIMERNSLAFSRECMKKSQYTLDRAGKYKLYYIMQ